MADGERLNQIGEEIASGLSQVAHAILRPAAGTHDAADVYVESLTEAVTGVTAGLMAIAASIDDLAESIDDLADVLAKR